MLPKKRRIERKEFQQIVSKGKRINSEIFLLYLFKTNSQNSRFSFSVSKKVCKSAVDRNRLRRVGYSIISKNITRIKENYLLFFMFKKNVVTMKTEILEKEILELLSRALMLE